jgi:thiamine pyrophosphate-dependent acetolactate synthase large subunit-like protein
VSEQVERPVAGAAGPAAWGSDVVVDVLRALEVPYLPLNPGSSFRGLHDSVVNYGGNRDPQLLLCLHEEIAVSLANGWAKATGRLGAAAVHDLVGLMHGSMAVYDAYCDRTPLLLLGGSGPADPEQRRPIDWTHSATTQAQLVRDFTVWDAEPMTSGAFVTDTLRAAQRAQSAPRGPAYVSLDAGVQEAPLLRPAELPDGASWAPAPAMAPHPDLLGAAVDMLLSAQRPLVVAGRVGLDPAATALVSAVVEVLGASYTDERNFVVLPTAHPQNSTGDRTVVDEADVVLCVDVTDIPGMLRGRRRVGNRQEVPESGQQPARRVIDLSLGDLGLRAWSNAFAQPVERHVQLLADPMLGLGQLHAALVSRVDAPAAERRCERVRERVAQLREEQAQQLERCWADRPISQGRLVAETWAAVKGVDHLLCLRNTRSWMEGIWQFPGAGSFLGTGGGGGVGYGPGALVGGALAARDRGQLGVGIIGDGDLLMAAGALWTAVHYAIPALVVVNDNGSFYNDEPHQAEVARHRGRPVDNSWIGMRIADPPVDIAGLARSYGCFADDVVEDPDELAEALGRAVDAARSGRTALVHVRTARG